MEEGRERRGKCKTIRVHHALRGCPFCFKNLEGQRGAQKKRIDGKFKRRNDERSKRSGRRKVVTNTNRTPFFYESVKTETESFSKKGVAVREEGSLRLMTSWGKISDATGSGSGSLESQRVTLKTTEVRGLGVGKTGLSKKTGGEKREG